MAVFRTADPSLLAIIESVLDSAGIPCVVHGEGPSGPFPLGRFAVGVYRPIGATVLVGRDRAEEAAEYLKSFEEE